MFLRRLLSFWILINFLGTSIITPNRSYAAETMALPTPGTMVNLSPAYQPALIKGITIHKDNPFLFDFIVDAGNSLPLRGEGKGGGDQEQLKQQSDRLIKYFFTCLTVPEKDLWVNLSPYEKNRMVPNALGQTAVGSDLLAQDYLLKQLTASLIYPEKDLGREFWNRVYAKAQQLYGTSQIPVNTFNKVWILADKASVYENNQTAFVLDGHLKVMLEEDYLAMSHHVIPAKAGIHSNMDPRLKHSGMTSTIASQIVREIILPELEKEVNTGKNFATLRQIFNSLILANWYKNNLKQALLNQVYTNKNIVNGIERLPSVDLTPEAIYQQYLQAYKKGVFNYIKEEPTSINPSLRGSAEGGDTAISTIPRKYFSGGFGSTFGAPTVFTRNTITPAQQAMLSFPKTLTAVTVALVLTTPALSSGWKLGLYSGLSLMGLGWMAWSKYKLSRKKDNSANSAMKVEVPILSKEERARLFDVLSKQADNYAPDVLERITAPILADWNKEGEEAVVAKTAPASWGSEYVRLRGFSGSNKTFKHDDFLFFNRAGFAKFMDFLLKDDEKATRYLSGKMRFYYLTPPRVIQPGQYGRFLTTERVEKFIKNVSKFQDEGNSFINKIKKYQGALEALEDMPKYAWLFEPMFGASISSFDLGKDDTLESNINDLSAEKKTDLLYDLWDAIPPLEARRVFYETSNILDRSSERDFMDDILDIIIKSGTEYSKQDLERVMGDVNEIILSSARMDERRQQSIVKEKIYELGLPINLAVRELAKVWDSHSEPRFSAQYYIDLAKAYRQLLDPNNPNKAMAVQQAKALLAQAESNAAMTVFITDNSNFTIRIMNNLR